MSSSPPLQARTIREQLVQALEADLVGPFLSAYPDGRPSDEVIQLPPSRWYLAGFLAPEAGRFTEGDPTDDDELGAGDDEETEDAAGGPDP